MKTSARKINSSRSFKALDLMKAAEAFSRGEGTRLGRVWSRFMAGALIAAACVPVYAGPEGEQIVRGNVSFTRDGATTLIRASDRAIINYRSFDIANGETVRFMQPSANSRVLNRINSAAPSRIDGNLFANGQVYFINPAGVYFGRDAVVDVAGLVVAAGRMSDMDFVRGIDRFSELSGTVSNQGLLNSSFVSLLGSNTINSGDIVAPDGTVIMGSAEEAIIGRRDGGVMVRLTGNAAEPAQGQGAVENTGTIDARRGAMVFAAGDVYSLGIRQVGTVTAKDIKVQGQGTGIVSVGGTLNARNDEGRGGSIEVTGQKVGLFGATIDASGKTGGGQVNIGGGFQGKGDLRRADVTVVDNSSVIKADATHSGAGGQVVVWADQTTRFFGGASVSGAGTGTGGMVETSSKGGGTFSPTSINTGPGGTWLIDPRDVTIKNDVQSGGSFDGADPNTWQPDGLGDPAIVNVNDLNTFLNGGGNLVISTFDLTAGEDGNISVEDDILKTSGSSSTLTLLAANDINFVNADIINSSGNALNVVLNANHADFAGIDDGDTTSGSVDFGGDSFTLGSGTLTASGASITTGTIVSSGGVTLNSPGNIVIGDNVTSTGLFSATTSGATSTITVGNNKTVTSVGVTLSATAKVDIDGDVNAGTGSALVEANEIDFDASSSLIGTGALQLKAKTAATNIVIGDNANNTAALDLTDTELGKIGTNFSQFTIGSATMAGDVTVAGALTFGDNLTLNAGAGNVVVNAALTMGVNDLTLSGAAVDVNAAIGSTSGSVTFNGATDLGANITSTSGNINLNGATTLSTASTVNAGTGNVVVGNTISAGANDLTLDGGTVDVNAAISSTSGDITLSGATDLGANITSTSGNIDLNGATTLSATVTVDAGTGTVFVDNTISAGANDLTLDGGTVDVNAAISSTSGDITLSGTTDLGANVTSTTGAVTASAATTLTNDVTVSGGSITFSNTIDSDATARTLTLDSTGTTTLTGAVGGTAALAALTTDSGGSTTLNANVTATGAISFGDAVALTGNVNVDGGSITFVNTINGAFNLNLNSGGVTQLNGAVGGTAALSNLTTDATGTTELQSNITATGAVTFNDAVEIVADLDFEAASLTFDNDVEFNSSNVTVSADEIDFLGGANSVTSNLTATLFVRGRTNAADIIVGDVEGTADLDFSQDDLDALADEFGTLNFGSATMTGVITLTNNVSFKDSASFNTDVTGSISAGNVTGTGEAALTFSGPTTVGNVQTGSGIIQFNGTTTLNGNVTLNAPGASSEIQFNGAVTLGANSVINAGAAEIRVNNTFGAGSNDVTMTALAGVLVDVNAAMSSTSGNITFNGPTELGANVSSASGKIDLNGATSLSTSVAIDAGTGEVEVDDVVTAGANNLTLDGGLVDVNAALISTSGNINVNGVAELSANITSSTGDVAFADAVSLASNATIAANDVTFGGTVNGGSTLTVNSDGVGATTFNGAVGGTTPLAGLITNADGTVTFNGAVNTTGGITLGDTQVNLNANLTSSAGDIVLSQDVVLGANVTIAGANITFSDSVDSDGTARALTLNSSGVTTINTVGVNSALASLQTDAVGSTVVQNASINTTGATNFGDDVTLKSDLTVSAGSITFGKTVNSDATARNLTLNSTGTTTLSGVVGGTDALASLTTNAVGTTVINAAVNTTGDATFNDTVSVGANITTTNGNVRLNNGGALTSNSTITAGGAGEFFLGDGTQLNLAGSNLTIVSNDIDLGTGSAQVNGAGVLTLRPLTTGTSIGVGTGASGVLQISQIDLDAIQSTVTRVDIGTAATGTHAIDVQGIVNLRSDTRFLSPVGGSITFGTSGSSDPIIGAGSIETVGSTFLNTDVQSSGGAVIFDGAVVLGDDISISTNNGDPAGADVEFRSTVVSDGNANDRDLDVSVGTGGELVFAGNVGGASGGDQAIGSLTVNGATRTSGPVTIRTVGAATDFVNFNGDVNGDNSVTVVAGDVTFGGNVGNTATPTALNVQSSGAVATTAATTVRAGSISFTSTSNQSLNAAMVATTGGVTLNSTGGAINANGSVTTTNQAATVTGATDVTLGGTVNSGTGAFTATANTGALAVNANVTSGVTSLSGATGVTIAGNINASGTVSATSAAGSISNTGTITTSDDNVTMTGNGNVTVGGAVNSGTGAFTATANTGALAVNANVTSGVTSLSGATGVTIAGNINASGTVSATSAAGSISNTGTITTSDDNVTLNADTNVTVGGTINAGAGDFSATVTNGNVAVNANVTGTGDVTLTADTTVTTTGSITGDDLTVNASTGITIGGAATMTGNVSLGGGTVNVNAAIAGATLSAGGSNYTSDANGDLTIANGIALSFTGDVTSAGDIVTTSNGGVAVNANNNVTLDGTVNSGTGSFTATASAGSLAVNGNVTSGVTQLSGTTGVTIAGNLNANGAVSATAAAGSVSNTGTITTSDDDVSLLALNNVTVGGAVDVGSGSFSATASTGAVAINANVTGSGDVSLSAGTTVTTAATITGDDLTVGATTGITIGGAATMTGNVSLGGGTVDLNAAISGATLSASGTSITSSAAGDLSISTAAALTSTAGDIDIGGDIVTGAGGSITLDSAAELVVRGVRLGSTTIALEAGDGATNAVDVRTSGPQITGATADSRPDSFSISQGSDISGQDLPLNTQFGDGTNASILNGMNYTLSSKSGFIEFATTSGASRVENTNLTLNAATETRILKNLTLDSLTTSGAALVKFGGPLTVTAANAMNFNSQIEVTDALTLRAGELDFNDTVNPNVGASLTLTTSDAAAGIRIGGGADSGASVLDITTSDLSKLASGFAGITFGDSAHTGVITLAGDTIFSDAVEFRGTGDLELCANLFTEGEQLNFFTPVVICNDVTIDTTNVGAFAAGANVTFESTIRADDQANGRDLTLSTGNAGLLSLAGNVGGEEAGDDRLGSLTVNGNTVLAGNVTIRTTEGSGSTADVTFNGTVDGGQDLTIITLDTTATAVGAVNFTQNVGSGTALTSLTVNAESIALQNASTTGNQAYTSAIGTTVDDVDSEVTLSADGTITFNGALTLNENLLVQGLTTPSGTGATFNGTVDSGISGPSDLTVNMGDTRFAGDVGATSKLHRILTDAAGATTIGTGGAIGLNTMIDQIYGDAVALNGTVTLSSEAPNVGVGVQFSGAVTTASGAATNASLVVNTGGDGGTRFGSFVGGSGALALATIETNADGITTFSGDVTTTGDQIFRDIVELNADVIFAGDDLSFEKTIRSDGTARRFTANSATATFGDTLGGDGTAGQRLAGVTTDTGGTVSLSGGVFSSGDVSFGDQVRLLNNITVDAVNSTFAAGVISAGGANRDLTVNSSGGGITTFGGGVGGTTADDRLRTLTTNADGETRISGNIRTTGVDAAESILFNDDVVLNTDSVIDTLDGGITFSKRVNSNGAGEKETLTVNSAEQTLFAGAVGSVDALKRLTTDAAGTTRIRANISAQASAIESDGNIAFNDAVLIDPADATVPVIISGRDVTFGATVNASTDGVGQLVINTTSSGETIFGGQVGSASAGRLQSLETNADGNSVMQRGVFVTGTVNIGDQAAVAGTISAGVAPDFSGRSITFGNRVTLTPLVEGSTTISDGSTVFDGGAGGVLIRGDVVATANNAQDLTVLSRQEASVDGLPAAPTSSIPFGFGGQIGANDRRVRRVRIGTGQVGSPGAINEGGVRVADSSSIVFGNFSASGEVLSTTTGSSSIFAGSQGLTLGVGERLLSTRDGGLIIRSSGGVTVGDLSSITSIDIQAQSIAVRLRAGAPVAGTSADVGTDWVAGTTIKTDKAITTIGVGNPLLFCTNEAGKTTIAGLPTSSVTRPSDNQVNALFFRPGTTPADRFQPLDLTAVGTVGTALANSIAGAIPRDQSERTVTTTAGLSKELQQMLEKDINIAVRDRLTMEETLVGLQGRSLYLDDVPTLKNENESRVNPDRQTTPRVALARIPAMPARVAIDAYQAIGDKAALQSTLNSMWFSYEDTVQDGSPDVAGFAKWLSDRAAGGSATEAEARAIEVLRVQVPDFHDKVDMMGLSPFETAVPRRKLFGEIAPSDLSIGQWMQLIEIMRNGGTPVSTRNEIESAAVVIATQK